MLDGVPSSAVVDGLKSLLPNRFISLLSPPWASDLFASNFIVQMTDSVYCTLYYNFGLSSLSFPFRCLCTSGRQAMPILVHYPLTLLGEELHTLHVEPSPILLTKPLHCLDLSP